MPGRIAAYLAGERRLKLPPEDGSQPADPAEPPADPSEALLREVPAFLHTCTGHDSRVDLLSCRNLLTQFHGGHARSHGGLGIAPHLAQRLAQMHGGSVQATSDGA